MSKLNEMKGTNINSGSGNKLQSKKNNLGINSHSNKRESFVGKEKDKETRQSFHIRTISNNNMNPGASNNYSNNTGNKHKSSHLSVKTNSPAVKCME